MKKILLIVLGIAMGIALVHAQTSSTDKSKRVKGQSFSRNALYIGILGPSVPVSLNYEHIWTKNGVVNIGTKIGGFYSKFPDYDELTLANGSFEVNFIFGRSKHLFEMGLGWAAYYGSFYSVNQSKTKHYGLPVSTFGMHYRFQKPTGGTFFKVGFTGTTILAFASNDLTELAIGNALIYGLKELTGEKPNFSLLSVGIGYAFRR
jgi:hypothetical protein